MEKLEWLDGMKFPSLRQVMRDSNASILTVGKRLPWSIKRPKNLLCVTTKISIRCRSIRIGSYEVPSQLLLPVTVDKNAFTLRVPPPSSTKDIVKVQIANTDVVKILALLDANFPILFMYVTEECAKTCRKLLCMKKTIDSNFYFDPYSDLETERRIILLMSCIDDVQRYFINHLFVDQNKLEEIDIKLANSILLRSKRLYKFDEGIEKLIRTTESLLESERASKPNLLTTQFSKKHLVKKVVTENLLDDWKSDFDDNTSTIHHTHTRHEHFESVGDIVEASSPLTRTNFLEKTGKNYEIENHSFQHMTVNLPFNKSKWLFDASVSSQNHNSSFKNISPSELELPGNEKYDDSQSHSSSFKNTLPYKVRLRRKEKPYDTQSQRNSSSFKNMSPSKQRPQRKEKPYDVQSQRNSSSFKSMLSSKLSPHSNEKPDDAQSHSPSFKNMPPSELGLQKNEEPDDARSHASSFKRVSPSELELHGKEKPDDFESHSAFLETTFLTEPTFVINENLAEGNVSTPSLSLSFKSTSPNPLGFQKKEQDHYAFPHAHPNKVEEQQFQKYDSNTFPSQTNKERVCSSRNVKILSQLKGQIKSIRNDIVMVYLDSKNCSYVITETDLGTLSPGMELNDSIIEFYLAYLFKERLTEQQKNGVHIFSSFFYTKLVTGHSYSDDGLYDLALRRHRRVERWTKDVDIFEKDFLLIPINRSYHWVLAIVCFPGLVDDFFNKKPGCQFQQGNKTEVLEQMTNIDQDEALEEYEKTCIMSQEKSVMAKQRHQKPCIIILDSLLKYFQRKHARIIREIREYLSVEWQVKKHTEKTFNEETIPGISPILPQQRNSTDCGIYLLQYAASFLKEPFHCYSHIVNAESSKQMLPSQKCFTRLKSDYQMKHCIDELFPRSVLSKKRQRIRNLILNLSSSHKKV